MVSDNIGAETMGFYWFLVILSTTVTLVNIPVLRTFAKFRKNLLANSTHHRILCSLCLADTLVGIFGTTLGALLLSGSSADAYKLAGNIPLFSCMFASVLSLALLTADRLLAIHRPFIYGTGKYRRGVTKIIVAIWCVPMYLTAQQMGIYLKVSGARELRVRSLIFVTFFCAGFTSLLVTNAMLCRVIRNYAERRKAVSNAIDNKVSYDGTQTTTHTVTQHEVVMDPVTDGVTRRVPKATKIVKTSVEREIRQTSFLCIVIVMTFLILWTPLAVYRFVYAAGRSINLPWLRRCCLCLTVSNSLLNPVIYLSFTKRLRGYFKKLLRASIGREKSVGVV